MPTPSSPGAPPPPLLLYSTNTHLKFFIQQNYVGEHHVWCSPVFEAQSRDKYSAGAGQPASSDPCSIYRSLCRTIAQPDDHDPKINSQRSTLMSLAVAWEAEGRISGSERDDIIATVERARFPDWRPLIFLIPFAGISLRVQAVTRAQRSSHELEYIIPDLKRHEFEIIEPWV
jgi:hypothetical protein